MFCLGYRYDFVRRWTEHNIEMVVLIQSNVVTTNKSKVLYFLVCHHLVMNNEHKTVRVF